MIGDLAPTIHHVHLVTCKGHIISNMNNGHNCINMNFAIIQLEEFDQCVLGFLPTPMNEYKTFFFSYSTIG